MIKLEWISGEISWRQDALGSDFFVVNLHLLGVAFLPLTHTSVLCNFAVFKLLQHWQLISVYSHIYFPVLDKKAYSILLASGPEFLQQAAFSTSIFWVASTGPKPGVSSAPEIWPPSSPFCSQLLCTVLCVSNEYYAYRRWSNTFSSE